MSSKPPVSDQTPKRLWEVLAEEHVAIGGRLPEGEETAQCFAAAGAHPDDENGPLKAFYSHIHEEAKRGRPRSALCFSGGGIRSATFNLGLLQRMVELGLLSTFDFLSTVSGGGYLGSWLSAWISRDPHGMAGVVDALNRVSPEALKSGKTPRGEPPLFPEPPQLRHLRSFSRYLSPVSGALSVDTWTLITIYFRNLTLNWLVLGPLIMAVLLIPRLCVSLTTLRGSLTAFGDDNWWVDVLLPLAALFAAAWSFAYAGMHQPSAQQPHEYAKRAAEKRGRTVSGGQTHFLRWCLTPLLISTVLATLYWDWSGRGGDVPLNRFLAFGILLGVIGWACAAWVADEIQKLRELPIVIFSGACTGLFFWLSARLLDKVVPHTHATHDIAGLHHGLLVCLMCPLILLSLSAGGTIYVGLISRLQATWDWDIDREWWARFGAWVLISTAFWLVGSTLVLFGPLFCIWLSDHDWGISLFSAGGALSGIFTLAFGNSSKTGANAENPPENAGMKTKILGVAMKILPILFIVFLVIGASLLMAWILNDFECLTRRNYLSHWTRSSGHADFTAVLIYEIGFLVTAFAFSNFINLNRFSLHGVYRDRLIRGYLGASRPVVSRPDPFTGFNRDDNISMYKLSPVLLRDDQHIGHELVEHLADAVRHPDQANHRLQWIARRLAPKTRNALEKLSPRLLAAPQRLLVHDINRIIILENLSDQPDFKNVTLREGSEIVTDPAQLKPNIRLHNRMLLQAAFPRQIPLLEESRLDSAHPMHIINIALNLVQTKNTAWQERKAESFTVSPLHSGSWRLGYRDSHKYGGPEGISLGTALTISGAAASPNMGYHTSRPLAFLMTLFNVRLGAWLGNPGINGQNTYTAPCPKSGITPLVAEAFSLTDEYHKYVYLSDGGHFEDLGLYEMVRRRCHWIIVGDGGCDPDASFEDLGNAVRKIRIDMGIRITFSNNIEVTGPNYPDKELARYCAIGRIHYKGVDGLEAEDGFLLYIKPSFRAKNEPADVHSYAKAFPPFPHQTTADQFFNESQFESYRTLGYHIASEFTSDNQPAKNMPELFRSASRYLGVGEEPEWPKQGVGRESDPPAPLKGKQNMAQPNFIMQPQTWTLDALDLLPQDRLDQLFETSIHAPPAKPAGPMPDGDALGIGVVGNAPFWRRWFAKFVRKHLWQGKVFSRQDDDNATLVNKITAAGAKEIHARVYRGPSRFDNKECIILDYSKTSFIAKKIRDEIREVSPGVYLGVVYWGDSKKRLVDFALDFNPRR